MVVKVDVTANHKGFFTFRLCANNNTDQDPRQQCFDQTILKVNGSIGFGVTPNWVSERFVTRKWLTL